MPSLGGRSDFDTKAVTKTSAAKLKRLLLDLGDLEAVEVAEFVDFISEVRVCIFSNA